MSISAIFISVHGSAIDTEKIVAQIRGFLCQCKIFGAYKVTKIMPQINDMITQVNK